MKPNELITKAKIQIQKKNSFFAYLSLFLKFQESKDLPEEAGMGVDTKGNCFYKKEFVESITKGDNTAELEGVITHEILHLAFLHLLRLGSRDRNAWNVATDLAINTLLRDNDFSLPEGVLLPEYNNSFNIGNGKVIKDINKKTAEEIYDELPVIKSKKNVYYILSDEDDEDNQNQNKNQKGNGKGDGKGKKKIKVELGKRFDKHIFGEGLTQKEREKIEKDWANKLSEAVNVSRMKGDTPVGIERLIGKLHREQIDWKSLLQRYIMNMLPYNYSYARSHKKSISIGAYMPDVLKEKIDVAVCVDTSGSIGQKELNDFLSEIIGIARAFQERVDMRLITHETEVNNDWKIENGNIEKIKKLKIEGGGGTSHIEPFEYIKKNINDCKAVIFLTDGYSDLDRIKFADYPFDKIFVINKGGTDEQLKGKNCRIIHLKD